MNSADQPTESGGVLRRFFSNPIVGVVGTAASIVGVLLAVYFYRQARQYRELTYTVNPAKAVVVKAGQSSQLSVTYKEQQIKADVTAVQIAFWNAGNQSIRGGELREGGNVLKPLVIKTGASILEAKSRKTSRDEVRMILDQTNLESGELTITWDILEQNDGGVVQLILAGDTETSITANAVIEGQKKISTIKSLEEKQGLQDRIIIILVVIIVAGVVIQMGFLTIRAHLFPSEDDEQLTIGETVFKIIRKVSTYVIIYGFIFMITVLLVQFWFVPLSSPEPPFGF